MKRPIQSLAFLFVSLFSHALFPEGFIAGTLVKTLYGYEKIENLSVGDYVLCCDNENKIVTGPIVAVVKKHVSRYAFVRVGDECIGVASDQQFYDVRNKSWVSVSGLKNYDEFATDNAQTCSVELIEFKDEPVDVYLLSVAEHHNFFVSQAHICAHNFIPAIVVGISIFFGSGAAEVAGVSCGLAGLGTYLGYKWHKNNKHNKFVMSSMAFDSKQELDDIYSNDDAQAPGKPTENDGYYPPKKWDGKKIKDPNGSGRGWPDVKGHIWVPTGPKAHRGPHWDVQDPKTGRHRNVLPGGRIA